MKNKLFVFMGYPGCGKSSLAKKIAIKETDLYLSSDELREEIFGFRDQTHNKELFAELHRRAIEHASIGDTYIDATNLTRKDRLRTISQFNKLYELHLICVLRSIDELVAVNEDRRINSPTEYIPDEIFKTILGRFQLPTYDEGWEKIDYYFITTSFSPLESYFDYKCREDIAHDNPHHPETIKEHISYLLECCEKLDKSEELKFISNYHDNGKFYVKLYNEEKGYSQFLGHAAVSAYIYLINRATEHMYINHDIFGFIANLHETIDTNKFITEYYGIYYHDLPYTLHDVDSLCHSLSKPSKPIKYMYRRANCKDDSVLKLAELLLEFNGIDRMREGDENAGKTSTS